MGVNAGVWRAMNTGSDKIPLLGSLLNKGNDPPAASIASINKCAAGPTKIRPVARILEALSPCHSYAAMAQARGRIPTSAPHRKWERR